MPDSQITALTEDENECLEALARVYCRVNSQDLDLAEHEKLEITRCVHCLQDRILAGPAKRALRRAEEEAKNFPGGQHAFDSSKMLG